jgi:hypothetical protein
MKEIQSGGKQVFIVRSHNQVLEAWEKRPGLNVFSLDFHTDTREAFGNYSHWRTDSEVRAGRCEDPENRKKELTDQKIRAYLDGASPLRSINDNLKHDEHIDFAVRTDMIARAFILSKNSNPSSSNPHVHVLLGSEEYKDQRIIEYSPPCVPGCPKQAHDSDCRRLLADASLEDRVLEDAVSKAESLDPAFFDGYILDIDCDYFNTERSLQPAQSGVFGKLVREAAFVTIALEPECVKICRLEGSLLTGESVLEALLSIMDKI